MEVLKDIILPVAIAIFASTGFWSWLTQRKASNKEILSAVKSMDGRVKKVEQQVDDLKKENDLVRADVARYRLLRFNGEVLRDIGHTEEEFVQALADIDTYERYCRDNPRYPNSRAVLAIENIRRTYSTCLENHGFL